MRRFPFARLAAGATLALALTSTGLLSAQAPNDPFLGEQPDFGPVSSDHYKTFQWHLGYSLYGPYNDIHVAGAWVYNLGHAYLGFLDGGVSTWSTATGFLVVSPPHEDLAANFREHLSPSYGSNVRAASGTPAIPLGHGMHVMGLAAGRSDNAKGISGVCRECSTLLVNKGVTNLSSANLAALIQGGVQVVNMSFGYRSVDQAPAILKPWIEGLAAQRDVVLVAAAGNDGSFADFPASHPSVIGVAGSTPGGFRWDETANCRQAGQCASNFGGNVQLAAPALNVLSAWYPGDNYTSMLCGDKLHGPDTNAGTIHPAATATDGYGLCTGTSMATPIVTGVAGLIRSVNPLLSALEVRTILNNTAQATSDPTLGRGIVQAHGAVLAALGRSNGAQVKNRLTPLFSLYSSVAEDYLYTTVPQVAAAAINDTGRRKYSSKTNPTAMTAASPYVSRARDQAVGRGYASFPGGGAQVPRAAAYIFTGDLNPLTGTKTLVPLYRLSYVADFGSNPNHRDHTYTTDAAGISAYQAVGYKLDGIEGYIYAKTESVAGTMKLLRRYNPVRDDIAIFPESQLGNMETEGYTQLSGSDWLGYVYPNIDTDGDGLINGFENLLGTNAFGPDSDLDGRPDNVEYPLADPPVSDPLNPQS
jgi:serine protease